MPVGQIDENGIVPIFGDGGIGNPEVGDGRLIPVLIIDCSTHSDLYNLILIHEETPPGDVTIKWGRRLFDKRHAYLTLEFTSPIKTTATFRFLLAKQAGLVDGIIRSRGVYLQPLQSGSKVIAGIQKPKLLVEIPSSATFPGWPELHRSATQKRYRKEGASRSQAAVLTKEHLARVADLWAQRMNRGERGRDNP